VDAINMDKKNDKSEPRKNVTLDEDRITTEQSCRQDGSKRTKRWQEDTRWRKISLQMTQRVGEHHSQGKEEMRKRMITERR